MKRIIYTQNVAEHSIMVSEFAKNIRIDGVYLLYDLPINLSNHSWGSVTHSIHIGGGKKGIVSIDFIEDVDATEIDIY